MAADASGSVLAATDGAGFLQVFDFANRRPLAQHQEDSGRITAAAVSPIRREIALATAGARVRVWDPAEGIRSTIAGGSQRVQSIQYEASGEGLVWAGAEGRIFSQPEVSASPLEPHYVHRSEFTASAIDRAGRWIAVADYCKALLILDRHDNLAARPLAGHKAPTVSLAFDPAGRKLASGSRDCSVRIWDTESAKAVVALRGHRSPVLSVCFSPNGERVLSGDAAGQLMLWDMAAGGPALAQWSIAPSSADAVIFGSEGQVLAAGGTGGAIHWWEISEVVRAKTA